MLTGGVHRSITDLKLFGGIGDEKLSFVRTSISRYIGGIPMPFGSGGSWRHNYYWNIYPNGTDATTGNEIIHVDYPTGNENDFYKKSSSDLYLTTNSSIQERIEQLSTDPNQYYLWFIDGRRISFQKVTSGGSAIFQVQGYYDRYNNFFTFNVDGKNRVTRVTEPAGRYLQFNYSSIGNFNILNANFSYSNSTATTVNVVGEFNGWSTTANPMTNNNGTWNASVPVQPETAYEYKFVVDGTTWVSDPDNPNTVPPGGPGTGNNSLMAPIQNGDPLPPGGDPVPVTFSYDNATASSVMVAGQFNNWTGTSMTKSGSTWTTTLTINPGAYGYKLIVDGIWQVDPANPFTVPDGFGGYNSRLVVGPLDEAITQVVSSDGRSVSYSYSVFTVQSATYSTLLHATYSDGTAAHYTYTAPLSGGRPLLSTTDDPRITGDAPKLTYTYQENDGVEGFLYQEKNSVTGEVLWTLNPPVVGERTAVAANGNQITVTYAASQPSTRVESGGRTYAFGYYGATGDGTWPVRRTREAPLIFSGRSTSV